MHADAHTAGFGAFVSAIFSAVLGIDAAWTRTDPTGVALAIEDRGFRLAAGAPS